MITRDDIRSILISNATMGIPADITYETELTLDSFTLVWLQHILEEKHDVVINPQFQDMHFFTSINGIHAYLIQHFPEQVASAEKNVNGR